MEPDWDTVPFHNWVTVWPAVKVHVSCQPLIALPLFTIVTLAPKAPGQVLLMEYVTSHPVPAAVASCVPAMPAAATVSAHAAATSDHRRRKSGLAKAVLLS